MDCSLERQLPDVIGVGRVASATRRRRACVRSVRQIHVRGWQTLVFDVNSNQTKINAIKIYQKLSNIINKALFFDEKTGRTNALHNKSSHKTIKSYQKLSIRPLFGLHPVPVP